MNLHNSPFSTDDVRCSGRNLGCYIFCISLLHGVESVQKYQHQEKRLAVYE